jgi:hypothetical protein
MAKDGLSEALVMRGTRMCIGLLLLTCLASVAAGWRDERALGPVVCRADFPLDDYEGVLRDLANVQQDLMRSLAVAPASEPIELYLFHDKQTYQSYMKGRFPTVPMRRALFIKGAGPGRVFVYRHAELAIDVRHEGTHALLHAALPMVPLWLDEGLAEYFEVAPAERAYGNPHLTALRWDLRLGNVPRIAKLEQNRDLSEMNGTDYRHAWAWVHFMLHGPKEAHDELASFLGDIHAGTPPGKLSVRLERSLPGVERRLVAHFANWKP